MGVRIITYSSSISLPPTIFIRNTLFRNTQMKLSYTHVHFIDAPEAIAVCDILVVDGNSVSVDTLDELKKVHPKTILWCKDIVNDATWFLEKFGEAVDRSYVVVINDGVNVEERDAEDYPLQKLPLDPRLESEEDLVGVYLDRKFSNLEKRKPVESIFSRLHLSRNQ
ncbi:hypothetical protein EHEL_051410 [Encephalitozoon hellem ATCC 50504]|uniref:Uncharacterized protein n=1 Tax=Encephalitozoon hellem TaxID=27973 RepID=A0A9Q9C333_ENCHE|nr:uncharacterized protein EHEL_051410 [Encephalitozoon hellem ATCC 50504]AFM98350.1 hypothetical protein EHEL_051410 [Encephalitozoon hellem ATCC 50504]UTX43231.1 hypothetical protein GPU96_05g09720 [Encephalitozoon hellem]|eukprot:XP_003887331.1 hypothetical protein EHEL_051410 [Encephalitozoon hellem ATCC 50504]